MAGLGLAALAGQALAAPAPPVWTGCQIEHGVLVVPAKVAGLAGQFILDTGTAQSALDATEASLAGIEAGEAGVPVRMGGRRWASARMTIAALDGRTRALPTPIAGVLGADLLGGLVLTVQPDPCRFRLSGRPAHERRPLAILPVERLGGAPYVLAGVSDGERSRRGPMRVSTGADLAVRLSPDAARLEGAPPGAGDLAAPLRALSLGEVVVEAPQAAIAAEDQPGALGEIGEPVWSRYGFSLDLRQGRLILFQVETKETRRRRSGGSQDRR